MQAKHKAHLCAIKLVSHTPAYTTTCTHTPPCTEQLAGASSQTQLLYGARSVQTPGNGRPCLHEVLFTDKLVAEEVLSLICTREESRADGRASGALQRTHAQRCRSAAAFKDAQSSTKLVV